MEDRRVMQIGYVVRDIEKSIEDYSKHLGIGLRFCLRNRKQRKDPAARTAAGLIAERF
jgi:hypothetical protein